ncbi:hypothetical protein ISN44_As07g000320 [Arabidopsis suecica]|uniref:Uncharacterized protein n=1 Tax=Arabidopsis suecica TaxID=45249 RepID=A0A8T2BQ03_ARASU|nr:hypothetical protein ISN44_As07g000320 [Arabidopsis suecica]
MKLEDKLRSAEDVSAANGFARETNISDLWKSLFDEEAGEATHEVIKDRILSELFQPILGESWHRGIQTLPVYSPYNYILGSNFAMQELREEIVRLGVELSLFFAESMFLLCDNIRSMLHFSLMLWRDVKRDLKPCSPVMERLLRVIHYVYSENIKPKNGVYHTGGKLGKWELIRTTWKDFDAGIRDLHDLYLTIEVKGYWSDGRELVSRIEEGGGEVEVCQGCFKGEWVCERSDGV